MNNRAHDGLVRWRIRCCWCNWMTVDLSRKPRRDQPIIREHQRKTAHTAFVLVREERFNLEPLATASSLGI